MNSYPLYGENRSPFCWGYWDDEKKKFLDSNSVDIIQCCMNSCKDEVSFCFDTCNKTYGPKGQNPNYSQNYKCNQQCSEIISDCESGCMVVSSEGLKNISDCAKQTGCGNYPLFDSKCLRDHKDSIIDCCKNTCLSSQSVDCAGNFCDDFFMHLSNGVQSPLAEIKNRYQLDRQVFTDKNHHTIFYVILALFGVIVFYLIYSLLKKK